jgi:hypothetical protein
VRTFRLTFDDDDRDLQRAIEFDVSFPADVFQILKRHGGDGMAILWEGDKRLGAVELTESGFWRLTA